MVTIQDLIDNGFNISKNKDPNKVSRWSNEVVYNYLIPLGLSSSQDTLLIECYLTFSALLKDDYTAARFSAGEQESDYTRQDIRELEGTIYQYKFLAMTKLADLTGIPYCKIYKKVNDFIVTID